MKFSNRTTDIQLLDWRLREISVDANYKMTNNYKLSACSSVMASVLLLRVKPGMCF